MRGMGRAISAVLVLSTNLLGFVSSGQAPAASTEPTVVPPGLSYAAGTEPAVVAPPISSTKLNVRASASSWSRKVGVLAPNQTAPVVCQEKGQLVSVAEGRSAIWDRLTDGTYVADVYILWPAGRPELPWCSP